LRRKVGNIGCLREFGIGERNVRPFALKLLEIIAEYSVGDLFCLVRCKSAGPLYDIQYLCNIVRVADVRLFEISLNILEIVPVE